MVSLRRSPHCRSSSLSSRCRPSVVSGFLSPRTGPDGYDNHTSPIWAEHADTNAWPRRAHSAAPPRLPSSAVSQHRRILAVVATRVVVELFARWYEPNGVGVDGGRGGPVDRVACASTGSCLPW